MAVDESILEHAARSDSLPTLRVYAWDPPCLSLGHAQSLTDVDTNRLHARGWDVVRRATGGRAILHTDELTYSVCGRADEHLLAGGVLESYNRIAHGLLHALRELELPVEINPQQAVPRTLESNPVCFEVPSTYEITVHGKKLIGSAQARRSDGVLQHGSLPLEGDLSRICEVLIYADEAARVQASQRLLARAVTVESVLGRRIEWGTAANALVRGFEAHLGIQFEHGVLSASEAARAEELVYEKYADGAWMQRA